MRFREDVKIEMKVSEVSYHTLGRWGIVISNFTDDGVSDRPDKLKK